MRIQNYMKLKRMRLMAMLPIAVMLLGGGVAKGQEPATLRLSLEEAQKYAVEHNYTMQNASLELQKAEYSKWQTIASMLPQVKAGFDYQNMCGYEMVMGGGGGLSSMIPDSITIGGVTLPISIPNSGGESSSGTVIPMNPSGTFSITASVALTQLYFEGVLSFGKKIMEEEE